MPKLHKNPYSYRFIAASHKCSTKPLFRFLNSALRLILKHFRENCLGINRNTGVNAFWIVENSLEVLDSLRSIPTRKAQLASFDFSTLYTAIPHNLLKDKITNLIHSAYTCKKCVRIKPFGLTMSPIKQSQLFIKYSSLTTLLTTFMYV